jgi:hypothetical protein
MSRMLKRHDLTVIISITEMMLNLLVAVIICCVSAGLVDHY